MCGGSRVYGAHGYSVQVQQMIYVVVLLARVRACDKMGQGSSLGQREVRRWPQDQGKNSVFEVWRVRVVWGLCIRCASAADGCLYDSMDHDSSVDHMMMIRRTGMGFVLEVELGHGSMVAILCGRRRFRRTAMFWVV